ncbi:MAG: S8 family serine peptidase, partial [Bacteroidia bacterium]|nr:S8 family serine peptidase [Bacteroidia bacterium]
NIGLDPVEILNAINKTADVVTAYLVLGKRREGNGSTSPGGPDGGPTPRRIKYINFWPEGRNRILYPQFYLVWSPQCGGSHCGGAVSYDQTPAFGEPVPVLQNFSSVGGTPILINQQGERIEPIIRAKPELCAPDNTNSYFFFPLLLGKSDFEGDGLPNFRGTSAAAPHAAAVAALMLQAAQNQLLPQHVRSLLQETALDMDDPFTPSFDQGFDLGTGAGFVRALPAVNRADTLRITRVSLINARNNRLIRRIGDGNRIILSELPTRNLALRIEAKPRAGSVKIKVSGDIQSERIENVIPFSSFGDISSDFDGKILNLEAIR